MHITSRRALRAATLTLAAASLAAPAVALITPAGAETPPAAPEASLQLRVPTRLTVHQEGNRIYTDLGIRLVARGGSLQINAVRPSYSQGLTVTARLGDRTLSLPSTTMSDFTGLTRFLRLQVQPVTKAGEAKGAARWIGRDVCLGATSDRVSPDSPATNPFPRSCWYNPYSLGSVQGIQSGWASSLLDPYGALRIGPGRYDVTVRLRPEVARALGMSAQEAKGTTRLVVKATPDDDHHARRGTPSTSKPSGRTAPTGRRVPADFDGPVPDLRSLPAWGIQLSPNRKWLQFSATVWNAGDSPLVVDGFRRPKKALMDGYQYFFDSAGNQVGYRKVGNFEWDAKPTHQHWHFRDFASYTLLRSDRSKIVKSRKEAFCLANTDAVDLTVPGAAWNVDNTDLATACGDQTSLSIREVLASGWGDTYGQFRAGQSFRIDNLPNGVYYIEVKANPKGVLVESQEGNNIALRKIRLSGKGANRKVTVANVGIIDEGDTSGYGRVAR